MVYRVVAGAAHEKKLGEIGSLKASGKHPGVVFIGDSITEGWGKDGKQVWEANYLPHPNERGYAIWARALNPHLHRLLDQH